MYNPVNMKIEDADRLLEKDIRDKNKKKRYEVRYDVEETTRKETLADFDRAQDMALKRISHKHTEEEVSRGFNILTNGELPTGLTIIKDEKQQYLKKPNQPWQSINAANPPSSRACAKPVEPSAQTQNQIELTRMNFADRISRHTSFGNTSAKVPPKSCGSQAPGSKRSEVRTGGFQKLGAELSSK